MGLLMAIPVALGGALGAAAGYFIGEPGMRDEYVRNYGMAGAMAGLVVGAILVRRKQAREKK
jgi:hypothetical protein